MKLTPSQRRAIFLRWLLGNQLLAAGGVPETMAEIGAIYGLSAQAVEWVVRSLGGPGNRRRSGRAPRTCSEVGCSSKARSRGRCKRCDARYRYNTDPTFRRRGLERRARRKASA